MCSTCIIFLYCASDFGGPRAHLHHQCSLPTLIENSQLASRQKTNFEWNSNRHKGTCIGSPTLNEVGLLTNYNYNNLKQCLFIQCLLFWIELDKSQFSSVNGMPPPVGWISIPRSHIGFPKTSFSVCNFSPWLLIFEFCLYLVIRWPLTLKFSELLNNPPISFYDSQKLLPGIFKGVVAENCIFANICSYGDLDLWPLDQIFRNG